MDFKAEIKKTMQYKTSSTDNLYEVTFRTNNPMIMDLGKLPSRTSVNIKVGLVENQAVEKVTDDLGEIQ